MQARRKLITDWLVYLAVRVLVCCVQAIPISVCARIADFLAWLAFDRLQFRAKVTLENLRQAFPEMPEAEQHRIARGMWRHIVLLICELVHAPRKIHRHNWRDFVRTKDIDLEVQHLLDEGPVIVVSGHFGNFEVGGVVSALLGYPTFSVARSFDNPFLDRFMKQFRQSTGQNILPKRGSSYQVDQVLSANGTLMLLGDQSAGPKGCWIEFFGRLASCHKSVALFSLTQNAPMVVAYSKRVNGEPMRFELGVLGVYDPRHDDAMTVDELTQWHTQLLEQAIREAPEQYWWLHRRWRDPPERVLKRHRKRRAAEQAEDHRREYEVKSA